MTMRVLAVRNVEEAFFKGTLMLRADGVSQSSRVGEVLVTPFPVMTVYDRPQERVLFHNTRDANPFFHLFESLWMLAGYNDARWLDQFVGDFSKRFAEEDGKMHGAYGHRWRNMEEDGIIYGDQLNICVDLLKKNPNDRRVVIQMWDSLIDLDADYKDVPCNTHIYLRIVEGKLDLTVMCRSNDIIWGAYGANAVHFSVLQEYLAGRIGVGIGKFYQFSNNWHAYVDVLDKVVPMDKGSVHWLNSYYENGVVQTVPMGDDWEQWDRDLQKFMKWTLGDQDNSTKYSNSWFANIATPMFLANKYWKLGDKAAARAMVGVLPHSCDWRKAAEEWMYRRIK